MATKYVRADGTATWANANGPETTASACCSLATAGSNAAAGDLVYLSGLGGVYRETLTISNSGSSGSLISFTATANTPTISAADLITGWTNYSGNIWQATVTTEPKQVWINDNFGDKKTGVGACVNAYDWYWASNVLYLYAASDPDSLYTSPGVEAGTRDHCIQIGGNDYIEIDGGLYRHGQYACIRSWPQGDYNEIRNVTVEWSWQFGIEGSQSAYTADCYSWIIEDNVARYCGEIGIKFAARANGWLVRRNTCYQNGGVNRGASSYTAGIKLWGEFIYTQDNIIEQNVCYDNGSMVGSIGSGDGVGIWTDGTNAPAGHENIVRNNLCYGNYSYGIFLEIGEGSVAHHNVCYDNATEPYTANIAIKAWSPYDSKRNQVLNNTCFAPAGAQSWNLLLTGESSGTEVSSNIFKNNLVDGSQSQELYVDYIDSGNVFEYNCFGEDRGYMIKYSGTDYSTVAAFNSGEADAANNLAFAPGWTNAAGNDFTLLVTSGAIGAGTKNTGFGLGLLPGSTWPDNVLTGEQDSY